MQSNTQQKLPFDLSKAGWDKKAQFYRDNMEKYNIPPAITLANMIGISKAKNVIEMACATGVFSMYCLKTFDNLETFTSCDYSDKMIEIANTFKAQEEGLFKNKNTKHEFRVANAEDLSFINDETQDIYLGNLCIHLISDANKALQEAKRILRKGGRIGLTVPVFEKGSLLDVIVSNFKEATKTPPPEGTPPRSPYYLSTPEAFKKIIEDNGFEMMYLWEDRFRFPCETEEDLDMFLNGEDFGPSYNKFDEETRKSVRAKILEGFNKLKAEYVSPSMKILTIIATKP